MQGNPPSLPSGRGPSWPRGSLRFSLWVAHFSPQPLKYLRGLLYWSICRVAECHVLLPPILRLIGGTTPVWLHKISDRYIIDDTCYSQTGLKLFVSMPQIPSDSLHQRPKSAEPFPPSHFRSELPGDGRHHD